MYQILESSFLETRHMINQSFGMKSEKVKKSEMGLAFNSESLFDRNMNYLYNTIRFKHFIILLN